MLCERPSFSVMVRVASVIIIPLFLCAPIGVPKDVERTADDKGGDGACVVRSNLVALRLSADALFVDLLLKFQPNVSAENIRGNKRRRSNLVVEMGSVDGKLTNLAASLGFDVVMKSVFDETDRVDNLVKQHALILKVDVKGKELPALLGASNLLKMNKVDVVIFSLWPLAATPSNAREALRLMCGYGYRLFYLQYSLTLPGGTFQPFPNFWVSQGGREGPPLVEDLMTSWLGGNNPNGASTHVLALSPRGAITLHDILQLRPGPDTSKNSTWKSVAQPIGAMFCFEGELFVRHSQLGDVVIGKVDNNCRLIVPEHVRDVIVEVGTNSFPDYLEYALKSQHTFFIGVEPIPEKFVLLRKLLTNKSAAMTASVPAAVSDGGGEVGFNVANISPCSSLMDLEGGGVRPKSSKKHTCTGHVKKVWVPRVALDTLLSFLPPNIPIRLLSIDAQGYDVPVVKTLRNMSTNVHNLVLECQDLRVKDPRWLYPGAHSCGQAVRCMSDVGFKFLKCSGNDRFDQGKGSREYNCLFKNPNAQGNPGGFTLPCSSVQQTVSKWPCYEKITHGSDTCESND